MARVARVLLSVPASFAVLKSDFSTSGHLNTGSRSSLSVAYMKIVMLSAETWNTFSLKCRLSQRSRRSRLYLAVSPNPTAEVTALSAGESGSADQAGVVAAYDEYAGEAGSAGEECVNAGCGDSAGESSDYTPWK